MKVVQAQDTSYLGKKRQEEVVIKVFGATDTMYTDQPGKFPVQSSQGHNYIMILYEVTANHIDAEPMKNRSEAEMVKAYKTLWERLTSSGKVQPKLHVIDMIFQKE